MKPLYANFFGVSKTQNADGELVELTLNISHKYMEQQTTIGPNGVETISAPAMEQIASILLTPVLCVPCWIRRSAPQTSDGLPALPFPLIKNGEPDIRFAVLGLCAKKNQR